MNSILWSGTPFLSVLSDKISATTTVNTPVQVTPHILLLPFERYEEGSAKKYIGIALQCTPLSSDHSSHHGSTPFEITNGPSIWQNPIHWWRCLQLLVDLSRVEVLPLPDGIIFELSFINTLVGAAHQPDPDDSYYNYEPEIVQLCSSLKGGRESYNEIMGRMVPPEIVRLFIKLVDEGNLDDFDAHARQYALTFTFEEVKSGTIPWSSELQRIGVEQPSGIVARRAILKRYGTLLQAYTETQNLSEMTKIEEQLYNAIERGIELTYGPRMTFAIAVLRAKFAEHPITPSTLKHFVQLKQQLSPIVEGLDTLTLRQLSDQYDSLPRINPLPE